VGSLTPVVWTDGGLATTLHPHGLRLGAPVEPWLTERPAAIAAAHRAFVDAGSAIVLAATFRSLPGVDPGWAAWIDAAIALARDAAAGRAAVWASFGPGAVPWARVPSRDRARAADAWGSAAARAARLGADGVALETFVDPDELVAALTSVRARLPELPVVASLVPRPDGALVDGSDPAPAARRLVDAGATGVGFNCGWGPVGVERALDRCAGVPATWWAKPAAGDATPAEVAGALTRLADRCAWVGGCCGVSPDVLAAAVARTHPPSTSRAILP